MAGMVEQIETYIPELIAPRCPHGMLDPTEDGRACLKCRPLDGVATNFDLCWRCGGEDCAGRTEKHCDDYQFQKNALALLVNKNYSPAGEQSFRHSMRHRDIQTFSRKPYEFLIEHTEVRMDDFKKTQGYYCLAFGGPGRLGA